MEYLSPLRYPGGKASLTNFLDDLIHLNDLQGCKYFEPYAGGAGAALGLLKSNVVSEIHLNDADIRIYAFWTSVLEEPQRFAEQIQNVPLTMNEWHRQREICNKTNGKSLFDIGFSTFYMNRCNHSGVISGGPIGGHGQEGKWRMDVRFNRENQTKRILDLVSLKDRIYVTGMDAIEFLKSYLPKGRGRSRAITYLDPPYVVKAKMLYMNAYKKDDHADLSNYLKSQKTLPWVMSYDDCDLIRELYGKTCIVRTLPIKYSLQQKRSAQELLIAPNHVTLPVAYRKKVKGGKMTSVAIGDAYAY